MPWSPLMYTKEIFKDLAERGYTNQVTTEILWAAIMRKTNLVRTETLANVVKAFKRLGYIELVDNNVWRINWDLLESEFKEVFVRAKEKAK